MVERGKLLIVAEKILHLLQALQRYFELTPNTVPLVEGMLYCPTTMRYCFGG